MSKNCRVCGLLQIDYPWGENGDTPTYDICPCCGVEFGNEDYTIVSIREYRKEWLRNYNGWFEPSKRPKDWNLEEQLKSIPEEWF